MPDSQNSVFSVNIKGFLAVGHWHWKAHDDICGICQLAFEACCPNCTMCGDSCPLVWGQCRHAFHMHCIEKWLSYVNSSNNCPICRQDWKSKS